jgi:hypothetical protein
MKKGLPTTGNSRRLSLLKEIPLGKQGDFIVSYDVFAFLQELPVPHAARLLFWYSGTEKDRLSTKFSMKKGLPTTGNSRRLSLLKVFRPAVQILEAGF